MGNEHSSLSGLELDEKAMAVTDFWTHHSATINSGNSVSVFIGEPLVSGSLWVSQTPLEKATKNLMLYRHPCILKYISSWHKGSKFYLAVEDVKPLSLVLLSQNTMQICVGLHSLLKALCFLHEKAYVSHNNVCVASVYVTKDGNWRLGGMQYLCRFMDLTEEYLCKTRAHRYDKGIDANESKNKDKNARPYAIDCFAFGVLVNEVLQTGTNDNVPALVSFRELCKNELQHPDLSARPIISTLLEHPFFTHDFIIVYSFLTELPLKSDESKNSFFSTLLVKLRTFNEDTVASQLGGLLLSRMVLLDKTAQQDVLPSILCPRTGLEGTTNGLFSTDNFKQYIIPRLLQIFSVRDAQIRVLLLDHFILYMNCFSVDDLQSHILPELLLGIKDTNDHLVSMTLRTLADMVPILGAATIIGGKRAKLFNDGRPITHPSTTRSSARMGEPVETDISNLQSASVNSTTIAIIQELPERPSPDGEEGETSAEDVAQSVDDSLDNWDDWGINDENVIGGVQNNNESFNLNVNNEEDLSQSANTDDTDLQGDRGTINLTNTLSETSSQRSSESSSSITINSNNEYTYHKRKLLPDITELDIKNQTTVESMNFEEFDFFQDMEPIIQTASKHLILDSFKNDHNTITRNGDLYPKKLDLSVVESDKHEEGWDGDDFDWN